jgi:CheY-like chemotaxis protein
MTNQKTAVIALLDDLMFMVKIQEALKRADLPGVFVKTQEEALVKAREGAALIILDLNYAKAEPLAVIAELKSDEKTKGIPLLAYVSHVQTELRQAAVIAGCDTVLARSAFVQNLGPLLEAVSSPLPK